MAHVSSCSSGVWSVNVRFHAPKASFHETGRMQVCLCLIICVCDSKRDEEYSCFPCSQSPPPAVDGCCDRQQKLTGRGKAARRPPRRLLYRSLHQIGAVSQLSPAAQRTLSDRINRRRKHGADAWWKKGGRCRKETRERGIIWSNEISTGSYTINHCLLQKVSAHLQQATQREQLQQVQDKFTLSWLSTAAATAELSFSINFLTDHFITFIGIMIFF